MIPEDYLAIQSIIKDEKLRTNFLLFYDKALADGDTVARLEERIKAIFARLNKEKQLSIDEQVVLVSTHKLLKEILWGDKPRD